MHPDQHPFFSGIPAESLREILAKSDLLEFPSGDVIFEEGAPSDALFLLCSGTVRFLTRTGANSRFRPVGETVPGAIFGEAGVMLDSRAARAMAVDDIRVLRVPAPLLRESLERTPALARKLTQAVIGHLHATTRSLGEAADRQDRLVTLGTMIGSIAHDFRTPLTLINLNAQLVETVASTRDHELAILLGKHCRNIEAQVERMMGMIEEVSDYSRGRINDDFTKLTVAELFDTFRFLNGALWENSGVTVEFHAAPVTLEAAPRKLLRVLQNLIGNAVEALSEQEGAIIRVEARTEGRNAVITVTDNGPGIPLAIRENFWEPFVTSGKARGTGLGTAICRTLVESHGGTIRFETETGRGTRFVITIPLKQPRVRT